MVRRNAVGVRRTPLSVRDIYTLGDRILQRYEAQFGAIRAEGRVDPVRLAEQVLKIHISFVAFSGEGAPVGFTSVTEGIAVPVVEDGEETWVILDGNTILIEKRRDCYWQAETSYRYTIVHETAHLILQRLQKELLPGRVMEYQADLLASSLLLPEHLVREALVRFGLTKTEAGTLLPLEGSRMERFASMASSMGVSKKTLEIRLKHLRLAEGRIGPDYRMGGILREYAANRRS